MEADGGWKKTLRNFGIEAKRAAERTTVQAMSRMGLNNTESGDPDPQFKELVDAHSAQTTSLKSVRDAAASLVEAFARVSATGVTLATAVHGALGGATAVGPAARAAEAHVSAQAAIRDGALRRAERRLNAGAISPIEDELLRAREITSALEQRRKVAADYRRYRARYDEFSGNENSEDAVKADDKLRELQVLAESLSTSITTAIPRRASLIERCAQEFAEVLRDFHVEAASALDTSVSSTGSASVSKSSSAADLRSHATGPDVFGSSDVDSSQHEKRTSHPKLPTMWDNDVESHPRRKSERDRESASNINATRRTKSAYVPTQSTESSIWDEEESPRHQPLHKPDRSPSPPPILTRRRGDGSSGYPSGGVGQRESTGYPTGGVGQRESAGVSSTSARDESSTYPTNGVGQKSSVYPTRRVPAARPRSSSAAAKQPNPKSTSRENSGSEKNRENRFADDLLGSFGLADPSARPPRQRKSTASSGGSAAASTGNLDDLLNFGSGSFSAQQNRQTAAAEGDLLGTFSARPSRAPQRAKASPPPKPETRSSSSSADNLNRAALHKKHEAEIKARAAEKLAAVREREAADAREREQKDDARSATERKINQWTGNGTRRGNLRALLASLDTVLYPGSTWKAVSMDVLKAPAKVKLNYRKAILQVHPDKIGPKNLPPDQQVLAELIFDELQNGYEVFTAEQEGKPPPPGSVGPKNAKPGVPGGFGMGNAAGGMYNNMGRGGMGGMGGMNGMGGMGMGGMGMGGMGMGGMGMGGMGGMNMGRGMNMNGMGGRGMNGFGNMYGAQQQNGRGTGNMPYGTGRAYGMGMNQQQRR